MHSCTSSSGLPGSLELIRINKVLLFTPDDRALYHSDQEIIGLKKISKIATNSFTIDLETSGGVESFFFSDPKILASCLAEIQSVLPIRIEPKKGKTQLHIDKTDKPGIEYNGKFLMTPILADFVSKALPLSIRYNSWKLLFSPKIHGISLQSFYRHVSASMLPTVLVVTDSKRGQIFGAFSKLPFECNRHFYGSPENFVFTQHQIFPWSCANQLFQFSDMNRIVIGGGPTGSSIVLFDNWLRGVASKCENFNQESPLLQPGGEFVVGDVEFWALTDSTERLEKIAN